MTSQWQSIAGIAVACIIAGIGAVVAADPAGLVLDPGQADLMRVVQRWLGILLVFLGPIAVALRVSVSAALGR